MLKWQLSGRPPACAIRPNSNSDTGGEFAGRSGCGLECGEARDARFRDGNAREPFRDADQIDGRRRDKVLEVRFSGAVVTRAAKATAMDGLGMGALDPGAGSVTGPECLGLLVLARALQRLEVLALLQPDDTRLTLGPGAVRTQGARRAVPAREAHLEGHAVLGPGIRQPTMEPRAGDSHITIKRHADDGITALAVPADTTHLATAMPFRP